jgi:hypothetical protein
MSIPTVEGRRFTIGKYDIVATPIPHSAHMLRYTVYVAGRRLGAMASQPTESDCRFLEDPPETPPLKIFSVLYRPGRPKKGTPPRTYEAPLQPRETIPHGLDLPKVHEDR